MPYLIKEKTEKVLENDIKTEENDVLDANTEVSVVEEKTGEPIPIPDELFSESHGSEVEEIVKKNSDLIYLDEAKLENEMKKSMSSIGKTLIDDTDSKLKTADSTVKDAICENHLDDEIEQSSNNDKEYKEEESAVDLIDKVINDVKINEVGPKIEKPVSAESNLEIGEGMTQQSRNDGELNTEMAADSNEKEIINENHIEDEIKTFVNNSEENKEEESIVDLIEKVISDVKINGVGPKIKEPVSAESNLESGEGVTQQRTRLFEIEPKLETSADIDIIGFKQTIKDKNEIIMETPDNIPIQESLKEKISDNELIEVTNSDLHEDTTNIQSNFNIDNEQLMASSNYNNIDESHSNLETKESAVSHSSSDCESLEEMKNGFSIV